MVIVSDHKININHIKLKQNILYLYLHQRFSKATALLLCPHNTKLLLTIKPSGQIQQTTNW